MYLTRHDSIALTATRSMKPHDQLYNAIAIRGVANTIEQRTVTWETGPLQMSH
jgi:hypothetical protein